MFVHNNTVTATPCEPGVSRKVMAYNDQVMMCEITFEKRCQRQFTLIHVQTYYIVKGSFAFTIDGETQVVNAGDSILMPSTLFTDVDVLSWCSVRCFTPMREDFIKEIRNNFKKRKDNAMKEYIENVLAPKLQGDGGWVDFVSYENNKLTLIFRGECSKCLILNRCVDWIAQQIKEAKGETVEITAVRKKPFFWDNV